MRDSTDNAEQFAKRLALVRWRMLQLEPFLAYLALELPTHILDEDHPLTAQIKTAATDGSNYYYNLKWCRRLSDMELMFVIAHEVGHVMFLHALRRDERDPRKWNSACDFVINWLLLTSEGLKNKVRMPHDPEPVGLFDKQYANHTAEQVYLKLKDDVMLSWDPMMTSSNGDQAAKAISAARGATARALSRTKEARARAKGKGKDPSDIERMAEEGLEPTVRWENQLQMQASSSGFDCHTWVRPNKKMRPHGYYLPSYRGFQLPKTLFVFDTSGSITGEFLGQMAAELNKLLHTAPRSSLTVGSCDTKLHIIGEFSAGKPFKPAQDRLKGNGGTDFREPFVFAAENRYEQVIYLTDTIGTFPEKEPAALKTIWLVPQECRENVPFGQTIAIPIPTSKS